MFQAPSITFFAFWAAAAFLRGRKASWERPIAQRSFLRFQFSNRLKGIDPDIYESFRSHCLQDYPEYEIVFGVSDPADPAVASVERLQQRVSECGDPARRLREHSRTECEGEQSRADGADRAL